MITKRFTATLWRYPGKGGWTFALIPARYAPPVTRGWGRTPVIATIDGITRQTSVWRAKDGGSILAVPKHIRGEKGDGDKVKVVITFDPDD